MGTSAHPSSLAVRATTERLRLSRQGRVHERHAARIVLHGLANLRHPLACSLKGLPVRDDLFGAVPLVDGVGEIRVLERPRALRLELLQAIGDHRVGEAPEILRE